QQLILKILSVLGYEAAMADNGGIALGMVGAGEYDVVLMDVQMPEMDGLEATRAIRKNGGRQPIIIAMTANAMQGDEDECLQAGMDDYVSKPVNIETLVGKLKKYAEKIHAGTVHRDA
ncbi:MAG: response regulator, partial [Bacteroidetes bacterium]|nr:response regulator [Bacteroidota bacterium]